jgi:hypothetical protein
VVLRQPTTLEGRVSCRNHMIGLRPRSSLVAPVLLLAPLSFALSASSRSLARALVTLVAIYFCLVGIGYPNSSTQEESYCLVSIECVLYQLFAQEETFGEATRNRLQ